MTDKEIGNLYDDFFGCGYWEKQYKQQITIFAKKIIEAYKKNDSDKWISVDDILLQENQSLKEQLLIAAKIIRYYSPNSKVPDLMHDMSTCDHQQYLKECE